MGGIATIGQDSPRYAENPSRKGMWGASKRLCHWSATAFVGSQLALAKQNCFLCQCKERCHTTVHASGAFGYVWGVAGGHWLRLQASCRRGLCGCVSLIPCLPVCRVCLLEHSASPTLLPIGHLQADSHPERPLSAGQASVTDAAAATQGCLVCLTSMQPVCTWLV